MGLYALYIGRLYAIHGTNANFGRRTQPWLTRRPIPKLALVPWMAYRRPIYSAYRPGTRVQFIDEPVKATTEPDGSRYIEVHNPLSTTEAQFPGTFSNRNLMSSLRRRTQPWLTRRPIPKLALVP
jgi:L,D-transpeptidase YbiS